MASTQNLITVIPDRFAAAELTAVSKSQQEMNGDTRAHAGAKNGNGVRRPTRGIVLKKDTFASIRVIKASRSAPITLVDAGSPTPSDSKKRRTDTYTNFLLQQVNEERMEKTQIIETFGEPFIFLFGERPRMMTFSGTLINTFDFNWTAEWWYNYDNYLRGTKCVENDARVFLTFDEVVVSGYIVSASSSNTATDPHTVPFSFQMFVTSYSNFSQIGDPNADPGREYGVPVNWNKDYLDNQTTLGIYAGIFGPKTISNTTDPKILRSNTISDGKLSPNTLEDGFKNALSAVSKQWTSIRNTILVATNITSDTLNAGGVRIPVGFAGSSAFEEDRVVLKETSIQGPVAYSTFDKNVDEYVVGGDQYATSLMLADSIGVDPGGSEEYTQSLVDKVANDWATKDKETRVGIDNQQLGPVSKFILSKQTGVALVGATTLVGVPHSVAVGAKDLMARFANSLPNPYGVVQDPSKLATPPGIPGTVGVSAAIGAAKEAKTSLESKL